MKLKILAIGIISLMLCSAMAYVVSTPNLDKKDENIVSQTKDSHVNNNAKDANQEISYSKIHGFDAFYSYDDLTNLLAQLQQEYPKIFCYSSLGKTWEGRDIWLVKISDNVTKDENESKVLYKGGEHGDEKQGYQVVIYSINSFVENYTYVKVNESFTKRVRNVVNNTELFFIPMVNPDGCEAGTRENARPNDCLFGKTLFKGVDLNRNTGYKWELIDEYPWKYRHHFPYIEKTNVKYAQFDWASIRGESSYRGPYPFSEPETRAIKQVVENHSIKISIDYHGASPRGEILYGWGWTNDPRPDDCVSYPIAENISKMAGCKIGRVSGVAPILGLIGDWEYAEHGTMSFGMELPKTTGIKPLLNLIHQNGYLISSKNTPILQICKTYFPVDIYLAEKAMSMS